MSESTPSVGLRAAPHLAVVSMGYVMFGYAGVPEFFRSAYGIDYAAFGLLLSATLGPFVLVQWPASWLLARTTTTRLLLVATVAHAAVAVALDVAPTYASVLALRTCWGLAGGAVLTVGATHVARLYTGDAASRQQGLYGGMITLGGAVGFLLAPRFVATTGGVGIHAAGALLAVPTVVVLWRHRDDQSTGPRAADSGTPTLSVVTDPAVALASLCYVAVIGSYLTLSTFVTAYFAGLGVVGPLNALVLGTATLGRAAGGSAVFRLPLSDVGVIGAAAAVAVAGFALLAGLSGGPLLVVLPFVVMVAVSVPFGAIYNVAAGATAAQGAALATVVAVGNLAALALPVVTGAIRDTTGDYGGAFALLVGLNAVALVAALGLRRQTGGHR